MSVLTKLATASIVLAGLSLVVYALSAFAAPDWTVAGGGLAVAAAGVAGLRFAWLHLAGLVPIAAMLGIAGPFAAYDLARPDETPYFVGSAVIIVTACLAAVFGTTSAVRPNSRWIPAALVGALAIPIAGGVVVAGNPASADVGSAITDTERQNATDVELIDFAFVVDPDQLRPNAVIRLTNSGALPHDFTIEQIGMNVFVPSGRSTYIRLPASLPGDYELVCTIGDHIEQGMRLDVTGP
jgi:hypothetical protein